LRSAGPAFQAWSQTWATEAYRILKPGAHLLAFGGTRTYHRLACAVEDAGFEIRDSLLWLYGSGFPKSLDVSKAITASQTLGGSSRTQARRAAMGDAYEPTEGAGAGPQRATTTPTTADVPTGYATPDAQRWQGWGTALKPSHEPIVVARKPLSGTVAANVLAHGTGALNIDGCRVGTEGGTTRDGESTHLSPSGAFTTGHDIAAIDAGRWPPNVILSPESAAELDEQSGETRSTDRAAFVGNDYARNGATDFRGDQGTGYGDTGGASRFFYCAKASRAERNAGLANFEEGDGGAYAGGEGMPGRTQINGEWINTDLARRRARANVHPTVKPLALMRWLCRLVTPPNGLILDPFTGSGTTGAAAALEGFDFIGIEREAEYAAIAEARCTFWAQFPGGDVDAILESDARARELEAAGQLGLFGGFDDR
jgi:site-specific DNA-methyltransferase (adenine-specific)